VEVVAGGALPRPRSMSIIAFIKAVRSRGASAALKSRSGSWSARPPTPPQLFVRAIASDNGVYADFESIESDLSETSATTPRPRTHLSPWP